MRRQQSTEAQITALLDPPTDQRQLVRHYTLSAADLAAMRRHALMLCYLRYPGRLDHRDQCLLGGLARLQERREVRALAQLGDAQAQRAEPGVEAAVAVTVAVIEPIGAPLVPAGRGSGRLAAAAR